jgi:hypothetical protein
MQEISHGDERRIMTPFDVFLQVIKIPFEKRTLS